MCYIVIVLNFKGCNFSRHTILLHPSDLIDLEENFHSLLPEMYLFLMVRRLLPLIHPPPNILFLFWHIMLSVLVLNCAATFTIRFCPSPKKESLTVACNTQIVATSTRKNGIHISVTAWRKQFCNVNTDDHIDNRPGIDMVVRDLFCLSFLWKFK